jgi:hypothetical protein
MLCGTVVVKANPIGTGFTYQGTLADKNRPANDLYDFEFSLYDEPNEGALLGSIIEFNDLEVIDGSFVTKLDFGSTAFTGDARWLQIAVRIGSSTDANDFTPLSPRAEIELQPYAIHSHNSDTLDFLDSNAFSLFGHNHDLVYASLVHSHALV